MNNIQSKIFNSRELRDRAQWFDDFTLMLIVFAIGMTVLVVSLGWA